MEEAKEWIIGNWVAGIDGGAYGCPTCPTCREPTYSMERCPFCDQLLKEPKEDNNDERANESKFFGIYKKEIG